MSRQATLTSQVSILGTILNVLSAAEGDEAEAQVGQSLPAAVYSTGVEADQLNRENGTRSKTLSSGETFNLNVYDWNNLDCGGGLGKDKLGQVMTLDEACVIWIVLAAGSAGTLRIGGEGSANAWSAPFNGDNNAKVIIGASSTNPGQFLLETPAEGGWAIGSGNNNLLKFEAVGGAVDFAIFIGGRDNPKFSNAIST